MALTSELPFFKSIEQTGLFIVDKESNKFQNLKNVIDQAKREAKKTNKFAVKYECKLMDGVNQFPDFMVTDDKNVLLQCELKYKCSRASVVYQINAMRHFIASEFWFILDECYDLNYIKTQIKNDNGNVRLMYIKEFIETFETFVASIR